MGSVVPTSASEQLAIARAGVGFAAPASPMRIIVGLLIACSWLAAPSADAKPTSAAAKHAPVAKKSKAKAHKKAVAKTEEVAAEKPAEKPADKPAPPPETRGDRAPVKQVVDDEEPAVRKRK